MPPKPLIPRPKQQPNPKSAKPLPIKKTLRPEPKLQLNPINRSPITTNFITVIVV